MLIVIPAVVVPRRASSFLGRVHPPYCGTSPSSWPATVPRSRAPLLTTRSRARSPPIRRSPTACSPRGQAAARV